MPAIVAVVVQLLPLLATIPGDISAFIAWIQSLRAAAQQTGEWSDAAETAFRASIAADFKAPEQLTDSERLAQASLNVAKLSADVWTKAR